MTMLVPILAGIGALCMSNPRRRRKARRTKNRRRNPAHRDLTEHAFTRGTARVAISTWRNKSATAFIQVGVNGPNGTKLWEAHSQGPSSGGYSKPQQAAERVYHKITGSWPSTQGSKLLEDLADAAAAKVGGIKTNPWRRSRGRRNPPYHAHVGPVYMRNPTPAGYKSAAGRRLGLEIKYGQFPERALNAAWIVARQGGDHTALEAITRAQKEMEAHPGVISGERIVRKLARELGYTGKFDGPKLVNPRKRRNPIHEIRRGDRVTIRTPQGGTFTGKAYLLGSAGWVLGAGAHGAQVRIANANNIVSVSPARR